MKFNLVHQTYFAGKYKNTQTSVLQDFKKSIDLLPNFNDF